MIPADLLKQLREADPELWEDIYESGFNHCQWPDYLIQGKLQDAIRARGWEFVLRSVTMGRTPGFEAIVYKVRGQKRGVAYTESEALCWAYLAALWAGER